MKKNKKILITGATGFIGSYITELFVKKGFKKYQQELGLNLDQGRLNILCSEASLPGSRFMTAELNNNYTGVRERHVYRRQYDDQINLFANEELKNTFFN